MGERIIINSKKSLSIKEKSASNKRRTDFRSQSLHVDRILHLQRTISNQDVQKLIRSGALQAKLIIGQPGDKYEQEADSVAEAVIRMIEPDPLHQPGKFLQVGKPPIQNLEVAPDFETRINHLSGRGQPLPESVCAFFEPRFGCDFSRVRIHTDAQSSELARALNARAFAVGWDVVFGAGQYAPWTSAGNRLLAHELTHVVQQTNADIMDGHRHILIQRTIGDGHDLQASRFAGDPVLEACFDNERLLRTGDRGPAIVKIQQALIDAGFPMPRFGADGIFGAETKVAVQNYQRAYGLAVDGIVGPITMGSLDAQFSFASPPQPVTSFSFGLRAGEAIRDRIVRCCNEALDCAGHKMGYSENHDRYRDFISCKQELTTAKAEQLTKVKTSCAMFVRAVLHWCGFLPPMGPYKPGTPMFESMGNVSYQHPAFVQNKDGNKPYPGDYFYIANKDDGTDGHTGIFLEEKDIGHWRTAEGGGGDGTLCRYVDREIRVQYFLNDGRRLQGWFDCTKILELQYFP